MRYRELLKKSKDLINENNLEEGVSLLLLEHICEKTSGELFSVLDHEVPEVVVSKFKNLLHQYLYENKPVQYLMHKTCFYGYNFYVDENVLIPRFETEELVENVLYGYDKYFKGKKVAVCDVACGSGCIGITLALEEKNMTVTATDISHAALEVAKKNARDLGANVTFLQGDMLTPLKGKKFDIFVSNPPYIPDTEIVMPLVLENEPSLALFGGSDGMKFFNIIFHGLKEILNPEALICFEHGYDKKEEMLALAHHYFPNAQAEVLKDLEGKDRMLIIYTGAKIHG